MCPECFSVTWKIVDEPNYGLLCHRKLSLVLRATLHSWRLSTIQNWLLDGPTQKIWTKTPTAKYSRDWSRGEGRADSLRLFPKRRLFSDICCQICTHEPYLRVDYTPKLCYIDSHPRSLRGVVRRHPEGGAGSGVLRRWLVTACPGRPGKSPARHYDLAARSSL